MKNNEFNPDYTICPSIYIQELASYFISEKLKDKDIDPEILLELMSGKRKIDCEESCLLDRAFGISKESWIQLQKDYDDR